MKRLSRETKKRLVDEDAKIRDIEYYVFRFTQTKQYFEEQIRRTDFECGETILYKSKIYFFYDIRNNFMKALDWNI